MLSPKHSIQLKGHGVGTTTLHWKHGSISQGITIHFESSGSLAGHKGSINVQNISLINNADVEDAVAISLLNRSKAPSGAETPTKNIRDIGIGGYTADKYWNYGIVLDDCTFTNVDRLTFNGNRFMKGNAILIKGNNNPVDNYINQLRVTSAENSIIVQRSTEGVYINQATMIGVRNGINWHTMGFEPLLSVANSHINALLNCITAKNILQAIIYGNLLYQHKHPKIKEWSAIKIDGKRGTKVNLRIISNNVIHGFDKFNTNLIGINLLQRHNSIVTDNIIFRTHVGVYLGKQTRDISVDNNHFVEVDQNCFNQK